MLSITKEAVTADVLCIGGGPAGLMAAIRAGEMGANVVLADKGNTLHSGNGSSGNDHFQCYLPEFHGNDPNPVLEERMHGSVGRSMSREFAEIWIDKSGEIVKLWDTWGIPMKYKGEWVFAGHAFPGRPRIHLKYTGGNQKKVLTEQALNRGVNIRNRITVFELLSEADRVVGAVGLDTWNDKIVEFHAKAVFLGTGGCARLYPPSTPGWIFNLPFCPYVTGDGRSMVYRTGGELSDMEYIGHWAGLKYFARAGKATWIGVLRDPSDKPIGPFITKPDRIYGDVTADCWHSVFDDYMDSGKGPVYMDCRGASKEDIDEMRHWLLNEGNKGILDYMDEEGIDPAINPLEFRTYEIGMKGGIRCGPHGETSLKGLYSAGDEFFGGMSGAAIWGWLGGGNAAGYAKETGFGDVSGNKDRIDEKLDLLEAILGRKEGASWREANVALQQIMGDYAGMTRSETLLEQGLRNICRLKEKTSKTLMARNGHELGRCLEVLNMFDLGELVILCAKERKETRGMHKRTDYPFTNPLLDKDLFVKKVNDSVVFDWR